MYKLAVIIGGVLLLAGVATAGTVAGLGSNGSQPTISGTNPPASTQADVRREDRRADRREDRRADRASFPSTTTAEARGRANEPGEDVRGREAEPNDDRGREVEPNDDRGREVEPNDDRGADSGHGGSGHGSDDGGSGHGGRGGDD